MGTAAIVAEASQPKALSSGGVANLPMILAFDMISISGAVRSLLHKVALDGAGEDNREIRIAEVMDDRICQFHAGMAGANCSHVSQEMGE